MGDPLEWKGCRRLVAGLTYVLKPSLDIAQSHAKVPGDLQICKLGAYCFNLHASCKAYSALGLGQSFAMWPSCPQL